MQISIIVLFCRVRRQVITRGGAEIGGDARAVAACVGAVARPDPIYARTMTSPPSQRERIQRRAQQRRRIVKAARQLIPIWA